jgi:RNA polymerase sigma-70 factor (ECF subfamily)
MMRVALLYVRNEASAEEAVQDAWLGVLRGLDAFEGRSSLRRWILSIVANCARAHGSREARYVRFCSLGNDNADNSDGESQGLHGRHPEDGFGLQPSSAEEQLVLAEGSRLARQAITALPLRQREVILLRDIEGLSSSVVCDQLRVSSANQRVLLHRARAKVRQTLELNERDSAGWRSASPGIGDRLGPESAIVLRNGPQPSARRRKHPESRVPAESPSHPWVRPARRA